MTDDGPEADSVPWDEEAYRAIFTDVLETHGRTFFKSKRVEPEPPSDAPPKFTAALAEPIEWPRARLKAGIFGATFGERYGGHPCDEPASLYRVVATQEVKMLALATSYGLSPKTPAMWKVLAMSLARDFVPGLKVVFEPPKRRGRPRGTGKGGDPALNKLALFFEVQRRLFTTNHGVAAICSHLAKKGQAFDRWGKGTLETAFYETKASMPESFASFAPVMFGEADDTDTEEGEG